MSRIQQLHVHNFKFFGAQAPVIDLGASGKHLLLYGENGSGKSSIYEGLKQFFASASATAAIEPTRHIRVPKNILEIQPDTTHITTESEVAVKVSFGDQATIETRIFGVPETDTNEARYIAEANLLNSFLSYRELLKTYLVDNPRDRAAFRTKFARLVIEDILSKQRNTATGKTFGESWEDLFLPKGRYKEEKLERFTEGLQSELNRINLLLPSLLSYFEEDFKAALSLESHLEYRYSEKTNRTGKHPVCEIVIDVLLFGQDVDNGEETHLTVLNEARLSALALCIYLAALVNTPQDTLDYKILFLDDVFTGLDMGNRLPLLKIIQSYKKPIIEEDVDEETGLIRERIRETDGREETEASPFFSVYQIFITTYDKPWFQVAKNYFETKAQDHWAFLELYAYQRDDLDFETPLIKESASYLQKAKHHFSTCDYPACANYLRKALEEKLKKLLPENEHYTEETDSETGAKQLRKFKTLHQYIDRFIGFCKQNKLGRVDRMIFEEKTPFFISLSL